MIVFLEQKGFHQQLLYFNVEKNANSTGIIENSSRSTGDKSNSDIEIVNVEDGPFVNYEPMNKENRDVCSNCGGGCPMYMATCVEKLHK